MLLRIWDLPTRLFHWSLVVLICSSFGFIYNANIEYHALCGYLILVLLLFRICWGFLGSVTATFRHFVKSPLVAIHYLKNIHHQKSDYPGHNPAGGLMILAMLFVLLIQASTGLFSNENTYLFFDGPLAHLVSTENSDAITQFHYWWGKLVFLLIFIHITANLFYLWILKENLIKPMIYGHKIVNDQSNVPTLTFKSNKLAFVILCIAAFTVYFIIEIIPDYF